MASELRRFRTAADRYLEGYYRLFPHEASELGLHQFDGELGENTPAVYKEYGTLVAATLAEVEGLSEDGFAGDDWLDRRGFLALLRTAAYYNTEREVWRTNPQVHCDAAVNSIFHLLVRNSERLPKVLPALESRLAKLPAFLQAGAACVKNPVPLWVDLAVKSCAGAETFLLEAGKELAAISPEAARTERLVREAARAFGRYAQSISKKAPGAANGYSLGRTGLEMMIRERTGFTSSAREIAARGEELIVRLTAELQAEARKHGRKKTAEVLEAAAAAWEPRESSLLEEYRRVNASVREQFERAGIVTFPKGERCKVLLVPPFLRHQFPTAAYSQPGAFDRDQTGIFWVNDLSLEQRDPAKRRAEVQQHFGLEFTCAHEAYPGHHLQFCIQNRHPSKLRRLFHHAIFYEGWTLWCEKMAVDCGIIDLPEARLIQLHDALWRAYRIGIDVGLHDGSLTFAQACKRLEEGVGFTPARARGDVNWYTSSATVPMSYLLGRLEVERLHAHLVGRQGWSLKQFNDHILSFGAIPWAWIWGAELRR